jgi:hypothetical protein
VGDDYYTMAAINQFLENVSCCVMVHIPNTLDAEAMLMPHNDNEQITYRRQLVNMTFNTAWLWVKEIRYHPIYVSASIYSGTDIAHCNIRNIVRHLGGVDRASQALIRWQLRACLSVQ